VPSVEAECFVEQRSHSRSFYGCSLCSWLSTSIGEYFSRSSRDCTDVIDPYNRGNMANATADNLLDDLKLTQADYNLGNTLSKLGCEPILHGLLSLQSLIQLLRQSYSPNYPHRWSARSSVWIVGCPLKSSCSASSQLPSSSCKAELPSSLFAS